MFVDIFEDGVYYGADISQGDTIAQAIIDWPTLDIQVEVAGVKIDITEQVVDQPRAMNKIEESLLERYWEIKDANIQAEIHDAETM